MAQWTDDQPWLGSNAGAQALAVSFRAAGQSYALVLDRMNAAAFGCSLSWSGGAADSWQQAMRDAASACEGRMQVCSDVFLAISRLCADVELIREDALDADRRRAEAEALLSANPLLPMPAPGTAPGPNGQAITGTEPADYRRRATLRGDAQAQLRAALADLEDCATRRASAERLFRVSMHQAMPPDADRQRALFATLHMSPATADPSLLAGAYGSHLREQLTEADWAVSPSLMADLRTFLDLLGASPAAMSAFIESLGPQGVRIMSGAGWSNPDTASPQEQALWGQIQRAFSVGTASWPAAQAEDYAEQLFAGATDGQIVLLGAWFDGPPYPGAELCLAVAQRLAALDRGFNGEHGVGTLAAGGRVDTTAAAFHALGQYPEQAYQLLDGLTPDELTWFFEGRDWGADGFLGIAQLILGAHRKSTGPDPENPNPAVVQRLAEFASYMIIGLDRNPYARPDTVGNEATGLLALTLAPYLLGLVGQLRDPIESGKPALIATGTTLGDRGAVVPNVSGADVVNIMTLVGSRADGRLALSAAAAEHANRLDRSAPDPERPDRYVKVMATKDKLSGLLAGAFDATDIAELDRQDNQNRMLINEAATFASLIPAGGFAADAAKTEVFAHAAPFLNPDSGDQARVIANAKADHEGSYRLFQNMAQLYYAYADRMTAGSTSIPPPPPEPSSLPDDTAAAEVDEAWEAAVAWSAAYSAPMGLLLGYEPGGDFSDDINVWQDAYNRGRGGP